MMQRSQGPFDQLYREGKKRQGWAFLHPRHGQPPPREILAEVLDTSCPHRRMAGDNTDRSAALYSPITTTCRGYARTRQRVRKRVSHRAIAVSVPDIKPGRITIITSGLQLNPPWPARGRTMRVALSS